MDLLLPIICLAIAASAAVLYNKLIKARNLTDAAWSDIDVQLKRRHELIPNLVELVKGYSEHERNTLEEVTRLRTESQQQTDRSAKGKMETSIGADMKRLMALVEDYPELKANESFQDLHSSLIEVEDDLQHARRFYNGAVRDYNTLAESFPSNVIANAFKFKLYDFFEIAYATERKAPDVSF